MPKKVYNNVEGFRLLDNSAVVEDVTSVTLPDINHPTTDINAAGMVMGVSLPITSHVEAMEFSVAHNNGVNCDKLAKPVKHTLELRLVRQRYNVAKGAIEHESVKYRVIGQHKSTSKGTAEMGNPLGATDKYAVLRYEEIVNGKETVVIDAMAGVLKYGGKDYAEDIESLLK